MYLVFFGLLIPTVGIGTIGYRISLIYFAVRDACYKAAISPTFTQAQTNAATAWTKDTQAWNGVAGTESIAIITRVIATGAETKSTTKLAANSVNTQTNMYFIRLTGACQIQPFFSGTFRGMSIPGFTSAYPVNITYQCYVENTAGLTQ